MYSKDSDTWEQCSSCSIFYVQRLTCQYTSHLSACRGWTIQKPQLEPTTCFYSSGKGDESFQNSRFYDIVTLFPSTPWGKADVQLGFTNRNHKTLRKSLWSLTVTQQHGASPHLSHPMPCRSKEHLLESGERERYAKILPVDDAKVILGETAYTIGGELRGDPMALTTSNKVAPQCCFKITVWELQLSGSLNVHHQWENWGSFGV